MASMDDIYGGSWLKAEEMPVNFRAVVTVESVTVETLEAREGNNGGKERKLALHFAGKDKALLCNVTNANMMAEIAGSRDYDYWPGHRIVIYRTMTDFAGKRVPALRIDKAPAQAQAPQPQAPPPPPPPAAEFVATDDDVPF